MSFGQLRLVRFLAPCLRFFGRCPSLQGLRAPAPIDSTSVGYSAVGTLPSSGNRLVAAFPSVRDLVRVLGRPNTAISLAADSATRRLPPFDETAAAPGAVPAP